MATTRQNGLGNGNGGSARNDRQRFMPHTIARVLIRGMYLTGDPVGRVKDIFECAMREGLSQLRSRDTALGKENDCANVRRGGVGGQRCRGVPG